MDPSHIEPQVVGHHSHDESPGGRGGLRMRGGRDVAADDDMDDDHNDVTQEAFTTEERGTCRRVALVSGLDVLSSTIICILCFSFAYRDAGVSLLCMGLQTLSHTLSSMMLCLRFWGEAAFNPQTDDASFSGLLKKERRRMLVREQIAAITMGIVMLLSSAALLFKAFRKMRFWNVWYKDHAAMDSATQQVLEILAWYTFAFYLLQAAFRFWAARKLKRQIIWHCFVASVVSLVFLFFIGLAASYQKAWSWKAEPIAAIALAFVTLAEGVRIVIMHLDDMDIRLRYNPRA